MMNPGLIAQKHAMLIKKCTYKKQTRLFLLGKLFTPNIIATQLDVQHPLHCTQHLLVWCGGPLLEVLDDRRGGVALGGEFLLGHLVGFLVATLLDGICDLGSHCLGLDDIIAAVDLGQMLPFATTRSSGLHISSVSKTFFF